MSHKNTVRKQKSESNPTLDQRVVVEVKHVADRSCVVSIEDHFAGYFNELGLQISVRDDAADAEVIELRNDLLEVLNRQLPEKSAPFSWLLTLKRHGKTIDVMASGDGPMDLENELHPI